jgi:hypothetical protein
MYFHVTFGTGTIVISAIPSPSDKVFLRKTRTIASPKVSFEVTMVMSSVVRRYSAPKSGNSAFAITLAILVTALLLAVIAVPAVSAQNSSVTPDATGPKAPSACGPPAYSCSRSDTAVIRAEHPPQLGDNPKYFGGHSGAGRVAVDPAYGNAILRVTDGNLDQGESFNTGASAEKNPWSYDESLFLGHNESGQLCLFQFDKTAFQADFKGCYKQYGHGGGADFGYTQADNAVIYNYNYSKFYRYVIDTKAWTITADPSFNGGQGFFDPDSPECLDGQIAAHHWSVHDRALSSDDNTEIAAIGPQQDADSYFVVWNASKGCEWLNTKTWQVSQGWNTGLKDPVDISWADDIKPTSPGGIHNAQIDRSGAFGVLAVHRAGLSNKFFWTLGTNKVDASCHHCTSHWACDYGVCFWDYEKRTSYDLQSQPVGSPDPQANMDSLAALEQWSTDEHLSHANAAPDAKAIYLAAWQTKHSATVNQLWEDEITGINWNGTQRTIRFNKHWNSGFGGFWGSARCDISHLGHYALCSSDYQMDNLDKGFGNGRNKDTCDHARDDAHQGTNSCRTDLLVFQLN